MSTISKNSLVHLVATATNGKRCYVTQLGTKRNSRGELVLDAQFDDDASKSQSMPYEHALIVKRRMRNEHNVFVRFTQSAGDLADFIDESEGNSSSGPAGRVVMQYKGILVRPYNPRGWCVHLVRDGAQLESVKGETVEEVADKVLERNLFQYAEKAPAPPPPEPPKTQQDSCRRRPGSI